MEQETDKVWHQSWCWGCIVNGLNLLSCCIGSFNLWNASPFFTVHLLCCLVMKSCPILCNPMPGSSVHENFQARIPEWLVISFSRGSSWPRDQTQVCCIAARFFPTEPPGKCTALIRHPFSPTASGPHHWDALLSLFPPHNAQAHWFPFPPPKGSAQKCILLLEHAHAPFTQLLYLSCTLPLIAYTHASPKWTLPPPQVCHGADFSRNICMSGEDLLLGIGTPSKVIQCYRKSHQ